MKKEKFVICYDGVPFLIIDHVPAGILESEVLDWYAREYAITRNKLSGNKCYSISGGDEISLFWQKYELIKK
jgi:hypothetical protein